MDDLEQRQQVAAADLMNRLTYAFARQPLNRHTLRGVDVFVEEFIAEKQREGLTFPKLVCVALPTVGQLQLQLAELEQPALNQLLRNLMVNHPEVPLAEIARCIKRVFPLYQYELAELIEMERLRAAPGWTPPQ